MEREWKGADMRRKNSVAAHAALSVISTHPLVNTPAAVLSRGERKRRKDPSLARALGCGATNMEFAYKSGTSICGPTWLGPRDTEMKSEREQDFASHFLRRGNTNLQILLITREMRSNSSGAKRLGQNQSAIRLCLQTFSFSSKIAAIFKFNSPS